MADARPAALSAAAILLIAVGGWAAYSTDLLRTHPAQVATTSFATPTALVVRADVRQQTSVTGTLGYAGNYAVIAPTGSAASGGAAGSVGMITRPRRRRCCRRPSAGTRWAPSRRRSRCSTR